MVITLADRCPLRGTFSTMASVAISATRFRSMLANRHKTAQQAAEEISTAVDLLQLADRDAEVEFDDLELLARYFKRPWSYLLADDAEHLAGVDHDNRTYLNQRVPVSDDIRAVLEAAEMMLDAAEDLFPDVTYQVPETTLSTKSDPEAAGQVLRSFLAVSVDAQLAARDHYAALRLWVDALQERGVYVAQRRLLDRTVRAFSMARSTQAVIVVDTGDTPYARAFSLLHEYCHVMLRSTGICDLDQHSSLERYCNAVAASTLLPMPALVRHLGTSPFGEDPDTDDERLRHLSHTLRVSQATLLIRLQQAALISNRQYDEMEERRRGRRAPPKKPGGEFYVIAINRVGRRFARNVFGALDGGLINRADAGVLLDVGEHLVPRYRSELFAGSDGS
jgi:Zn-dependent peptidase ImmA (M78 family)